MINGSRRYQPFRLGGLVCLLLFVLFLVQPGWAATPAAPPPNAGGPVKVAVDTVVNKIYQIDTIAESYTIDAYLTLTWNDPRLADLLPAGREKASYFNDQADELLAKDVWWPVPEFTNMIGSRDIVNREVFIKRNGDVSVIEHFAGTFTSDMDFREYPFDRQEFKVIIESFSYDETEMEFVSKAAAYQKEQVENPEWDFSDPNGAAVRHKYKEWPKAYSSYTFRIEADRKYGYFIWQFFFPLAMIVVASWIVFWISDFGNQLGTAFTLLLTVVAFNFYASTLLLRLPYNTFIEIAIISGYVTIFLTLLIIVLQHQLVQRGRDISAARLNMASRLLFPAGNVLAVYWLKLSFLG